MLDGFHDRESSHTACRNKVHLTALESEVFTGGVTVNKQHPKGASIGKWYTSSDDVLWVGLVGAQPGQALHIFLMNEYISGQ